MRWGAAPDAAATIGPTGNSPDRPLPRNVDATYAFLAIERRPRLNVRSTEGIESKYV